MHGISGSVVIINIALMDFNMKKLKKLNLVVLIFTVILISTNHVIAQWSTNPEENIMIYASAGIENYQIIIS